jgi:glycerol kinase
VKTVLAIDQGTTGSTVLLIGANGLVLGRAYREFTQHFPRPGLVEHDAEEIWRVTLEAAREVLQAAAATPTAIGITNQRETVVTWDRATGQPLHRAIVWQDRRTTERCRALRAEYGVDYLYDRTGLVWDPYFSGTKIEWLLEHVPDLRARAEAGDAVFGTIDAWLVSRLTAGEVLTTDHSNASRTLLYNISTMGWDDELLGLFGVPRQALPEVRKSSEVLGVSNGDVLGAEIPVAGVAGDQQAALFGQGCWAPGEAKNTYGTGAFLLMNVGGSRPTDEKGSGLLTTVGCDAMGNPVYALEGSIFIAGAAVQWLRDGLGIIATAAETEALAQGIDDTGGVYFVPALVGLGAPYWEPDARGTIVGLTRGTTRAHLARAALEAMTYGTKDVVHAMVEASGVPLLSLKVDGGAAANDWLMQFQADVVGVQVARPDVVETTAMGAAGLAGLATDVWEKPGDFLTGRSYQMFAPQADRSGEYAGWRRAVDSALRWVEFGR